MKKTILMAMVMTALLIAPAAWACNYTFDVSLVKISADPVRSAANTLGFDDWYIWKYRVDVVSSGSTNKALSHWVLQLPNCYVASKYLFKEIEASAGSGEGNRIRVYDPEGVNPDPRLGISGLKWDWEATCKYKDALDVVGEYDYFWFSVPTDESIDVDWGVKAGTKKVFGEVEGPDCPDCEHPGSETPEPMSMVLFGAGLAGMVLRNRNRKRGA